MQTIKDALREIRRYPSAIAGLFIVFLLVLVSIYAVITIPYREAITLWRGGEGTWRNPVSYTHLRAHET
jgi:peptide/nickel transport system permease protein